MANTIDVNAPAISNETVASIAAQATPVTTPVETQVAEPVVNNEVTPEVTQAPAE